MKLTYPNFRNLSRMLRIIDVGSVTDVAEAVGRSQQTISHSIQALEEEIGVRLFERTSLGTHPTREAAVLGERVRSAIAHLTKARGIFCNYYGSVPAPRNLRIWDFNVSNQHIFVFLSLCEHREAKRVSGELNLDVSAVRKSVRALQAQVGQPLFEKVSRGFLIPTEFAEQLARQIKLALAEIRAGLDELVSLGGVIQGEVIVGAAPHARSTLLPRIAARLYRKCPKLTLSLRYDSYEDLERGLSYREVDFILGSERAHPTSPDITAHPLLRDRMEILARANHPLAKLPHPDIRRYLDADWVLPPCYVPMRRRFSEFLSAHGFSEPAPAFETGDSEVVKGLLLETDCLAFALRCDCAQEVEHGVLTFLPCPEELTVLLRSPVTLHLTFPTRAVRPPSAQAFFDEAAIVAAELQEQHATWDKPREPTRRCSKE
jgi:LysR family transcriptional regulator, regulator for genes of the gallate degradation pathway